MPPGAVYVGRRTKFGNPFHAEPATPATRAAAVDRYRAWLAARPALIAAARCELAGRNLACWCPLDGLCHADVLLSWPEGRRCDRHDGPSPGPPTACRCGHGPADRA